MFVFLYFCGDNDLFQIEFQIMLRKLRIALAAVFFTGISLLFLDFTGVLHLWLGWMAEIQFIPAVLAMNFGIVAALLLLTLLFGRIYCSVICPLGVMQDIISWIHGKTKKKNLYRFKYRKPLTVLRYGVLAAFIAAMALGVTSIAALIAPYSAYGRIATELFAPIYRGCNNLFAMIAEHFDSYAFYTTEVWVKSGVTLAVAAVTFALLAFLSWKWGRIWCNSICPVGSLLGLVSRFSLFAPVIDTAKCRNCGLCGKRCKSSCIDVKSHRVDRSRCVVCLDCISVCRDGAIQYRFRFGENVIRSGEPENGTRREFLKTTALAAGTLAAVEMARPLEAAAQQMKVDGGLITLPEKKAPKRETPLKPAGSGSLKHFSDHCIACQLCVSACPNQVLRPSLKLETLMQPEMSYEKGYCRPECTECSSVCPAGAIVPVSREEKSSIQIGHAVVDYSLCVADAEGVKCGNCARHCPAGAIRMVRKDAAGQNTMHKDAAGGNRSAGDAAAGRDSVRIPSVNEERCIGCGACEYNCPAAPLSAIRVEGHREHREL